MYRTVILILVPFLRLFWRWRFLDLHHIPKDGPVIVASNHISYFDPLCLALCINSTGRVMRFFAKAELWKNPVLRFIFLRTKMIPVERGSGDGSPIVKAEEALAQGELVIVYPESTITKNLDLSPMQGKTGVARLALATGAPVYPVAVWGSHWIIPPGSKTLKRKGFRKVIIMKVGEPLTFGDLVGRQDDPEVRRDVTDRVMKELDHLVRDLRTLHPRGSEVPPRPEEG